MITISDNNLSAIIAGTFALASGLIQLANMYITLKFKNQSAATASEVKTALAVNTAATFNQADQIKQAVADNTAVTEATHELVNGGMSEALLTGKISANALAESSGKAKDIAASMIADQKYKDHMDWPATHEALKASVSDGPNVSDSPHGGNQPPKIPTRGNTTNQ